MGRSLKYDIPCEDWRLSPMDFLGESGSEVDASEFNPGDCLRSVEAPTRGLEHLFRKTLASPRRVVLEIGFGRGEFLLDLAQNDPEAAFLGVEVSFKRVLKLARKLARAELTNVRILEARAENVVRDLIPPHSVDEVWINFSDPWPKARHEGRRLIQPLFIAELSGCLKAGALLHVATDDVPYAEQIDQILSDEKTLLSDHPDRDWLPEIPGRKHTGYETEWRQAGRPLHFFEYRRCPSRLVKAT